MEPEDPHHYSKIVNLKHAASPSMAKEAIGAYEFCNKTLRAWLATYSVGVPAFVLTKQSVMTRLAAAHMVWEVGLLFAIGVALQVALTFINKYTQWGVYVRYGEEPVDNWLTRFCEWLSNVIWIDLSFDILTIMSLAAGSSIIFASLVST